MRIANYNPNSDPVWHLLDKWQQHIENQGTRAAAATWQPFADVCEQAEQFLITLDVPGVAPSSLDIKMEHGVLSVAGTRTQPSTPTLNHYQHQERPQGGFLRQFNVPEVADVNNIKANVRQGVLTITIPRKLRTQSRKIQVS